MDARDERRGSFDEVELDELVGGRVASLSWQLGKLGIAARTAIAFAIMMGLVAVVIATNAPNPNMILVAGLVVCSTLFEWPGGIVAATVMMGYTLYFFSTDHSWFSFEPMNMQKVVVTTAGVAIVTFFTCVLKNAENQLFHKLLELTQVLKEDNALLAQASGIDALTGLRNRFSLRRDYQGYVEAGRPLLVAMIDLDNFKTINDEHGHECGDYALSQVGKTLRELFGVEASYRYGGDEFLVIATDTSREDFEAKTTSLQDGLRLIDLGDEAIPLQLSVGYVFGLPVLSGDLRLMLHQADECLYEAKRQGKDCAIGRAFARLSH